MELGCLIIMGKRFQWYDGCMCISFSWQVGVENFLSVEDVLLELVNSSTATTKDLDTNLSSLIMSVVRKWYSLSQIFL